MDEQTRRRSETKNGKTRENVNEMKFELLKWNGWIFGSSLSSSVFAAVWNIAEYDYVILLGWMCYVHVLFLLMMIIIIIILLCWNETKRKQGIKIDCMVSFLALLTYIAHRFLSASFNVCGANSYLKIDVKGEKYSEAK